jgi:hypothetical protein
MACGDEFLSLVTADRNRAARLEGMQGHAGLSATEPGISDQRIVQLNRLGSADPHGVRGAPHRGIELHFPEPVPLERPLNESQIDSCIPIFRSSVQFSKKGIVKLRLGGVGLKEPGREVL